MSHTSYEEKIINDNEITYGSSDRWKMALLSSIWKSPY